MPQMSWNNFVEKYPASPGFAAQVSKRLPKGVRFDKAQKVLPTPFGLFRKWAETSIAGDWTTQSTPGGFIVRVATGSDIKTLQATFSCSGPAQKTPACDKTFLLGYRNEHYPKLAKHLGYKL